MEKNTGIELMPLIQNGDEILVDARLLHKFLKAGKDFRHWIMDRIKDYNFEEGKDFLSILTESSGGRPSKEYALTLDMAKELAMVERRQRQGQAGRAL